MNSMTRWYIEEPVCKGWVLNDCLGMGSSGVKVIRADKLCQLWPLEMCCTVGEEEGWQTQCVHHGEEVTPLMLPVLLGAMQIGGIVEHSIGEGLPLSSHHVPQLVQGELDITWVLPDVDSASLKGTMSHLSIESEEMKSWVSSETTIIVLYQMFEVVANGDLDLTLSQEVACTSGEEDGEGTCEISLSYKITEWHSSSRRPHQSSM